MRHVLVLVRAVVVVVFAGVAGPPPFILMAQTSGLAKLDFSHSASEEECRALLQSPPAPLVREAGAAESRRSAESRADFLIHADRFGELLGRIVEASNMAKENAVIFTKEWQGLWDMEGGEVKLKEDAVETLFSTGGARYDCIIYAAEAYHGQMTSEEFRNTLYSVGLLSGRLKDMLTNEITSAENDQIKASFENLRNEVQLREDKVNELKKELATGLEKLKRSILKLKEWKRVVVYSAALDLLDEAIVNLKRMVADVAEFERLINDVVDHASGLSDATVVPGAPRG